MTTLVLQVIVLVVIGLLAVVSVLDSGEVARGIMAGEGVLVADACVILSPSFSRGTSAG